jgi:hypothetical protein
MSTRQQNNMRLAINLEHVCVAVRIATVIQVAGFITIESGVYDVLQIEAEQIAIADSELVVVFFALVRQGIADFLPDILNHDVFGVEGLAGK